MSTASFEVVDDVFHYTSKAGHKIEIDFDFPADVLKNALTGDKSEEEQFDAVRQIMGDGFEEAYNAMGALERTRFQRTFFTEFGKAAELPLGESQSSSRL